jgi:peptidoglycan/LPS O-acetylase OafA/YrhL
MVTVARNDALANASHTASSRPFSQPVVALDGLRGLAIALVVWHHLDAYTALQAHAGAKPASVAAPWPWLHPVAQNAALGVMLFMVLSGFLLFLPYARALLNSADVAWPNAWAFFVRRCRRILPGYAIVLLGILAATASIAATRHLQSGVTWDGAITGVFLVFNHRLDTNNFIAAGNPVIGVWDAPLWSLAVEWQFYLILPAVAWVLGRVAKQHPRLLVIALPGLMALGLAVRGVAAWAHYAAGFATPAEAPGLLGAACSLLFGIRGTYLEVFALGMLGSVAYVWSIERGCWSLAVRHIIGGILLVLAVSGACCVGAWQSASGRFDTPEGFYWPNAARHGFLAVSWAVAGEWTAAVCALALLLAVVLLPTSMGRLFELRPLTLLGLISYSVYLWHWPLMNAVLGYQTPGQEVSLQAVELAAAVLLLILLWSTMLYLAVERPLMARRKSRVRASAT